MVIFVSSFGRSVAVEDDVYTNRLILGSLAEEMSALTVPLMLFLMTTLGSVDMLMSLATWMKPDAPGVNN